MDTNQVISKSPSPYHTINLYLGNKEQAEEIHQLMQSGMSKTNMSRSEYIRHCIKEFSRIVTAQ